jgi:peroxiredoxin Q/BCP
VGSRECSESITEEDAMPHARCLRIACALAIVLIAVALVTPAMALQVGEKAPDFELPGSQGKPVKLSELTAKGPVVIYTFIAAFTGT